MSEEEVKPNDAEEERGTSDETPRSGGPDSSAQAGCCNAGMKQMMEKCPCGSIFKRRRGAIYAVLAVMLSALIISQVGGILGIIAFFRTF